MVYVYTKEDLLEKDNIEKLDANLESLNLLSQILEVLKKINDKP